MNNMNDIKGHEAAAWAMEKDFSHARAKLTLVIIAHLHDEMRSLPFGKVMIEHSKLLELARVSRVSLMKYLKVLEEDGAIKIERLLDGRKQTTNIYTLQMDKK